MVGFCILSFVLIVVDHLSDYLDDIRAGLTILVTPVLVAADIPGREAREISEMFSSRDEMRSHIKILEQDLTLLKAKTAKMAALTAENNRLRDLLGSAAKLQDNVLVAELISVDPDPEKHEVVIDKGSADGVFVGQPLLDAQGLMGQVISLSFFTSRVLLISDRSHSVPVQVSRTNLRLIAQGTGVTNRLELMHVQDTADIRPGDLLVSSGLGNRFPVGYPVGIVDRVEHDPGRPFAVVTAIPSAALDRSRHVLLVFTEEKLVRAAEVRRNGSGG
ncbi:MAG: rod shape-determining protein MreC [Proteobacteria bacterium]|nr:rod shape-determining protein MreC [Pseudomonadota bacterium]